MKKSDGELKMIAVEPRESESGDGGRFVTGREAAVPDPEVDLRPRRRRFSASYKARIVEEAERCTEYGDIGSLLRRKGLYSSHLSTWREQYRAGALDALRDDNRGRKCTRSPLEDAGFPA